MGGIRHSPHNEDPHDWDAWEAPAENRLHRFEVPAGSEHVIEYANAVRCRFGAPFVNAHALDQLGKAHPVLCEVGLLNTPLHDDQLPDVNLPPFCDFRKDLWDAVIVFRIVFRF